MKPAQMLRTIKAAPPPVAKDYAAGANLSAYACVKQKTCPICGQKGEIETYLPDHAEFFYCSNRQHIFEVDNNSGDVDYIDMGG